MLLSGKSKNLQIGTVASYAKEFQVDKIEAKRKQSELAKSIMQNHMWLTI
jgi:hypothetical protein